MSIIKQFRQAQMAKEIKPDIAIDSETLDQLLRESYFSEGHIGEQYGYDAATKFANENNWILRELSIDEILDANQKKAIVKWLKEEENAYGEGKFGFYADPIIIGPDDYGAEQPIKIAGYTVYDGWHRLAAAVRAKKQTIMVYFGIPK